MLKSMLQIPKNKSLLVLNLIVIFTFRTVLALEFPIKSYIYEEESWKCYDFEPTGFRGVYFDRIIYDSKQLWLFSGAIYKMDIETGEIFKPNLFKNMTNIIYKDSKGTLWISTLDKLYKLSENKIVREIDLPTIIKRYGIEQVIEDVENNLWFFLRTSKSIEIMKFDGKSWKSTRYPNIPKGYMINLFGLDIFGNIYVSYYREDWTGGGVTPINECIAVFRNSKWCTIYNYKFPNKDIGIGLSKFIIPFEKGVLISLFGKGLFLYRDGKMRKFSDKSKHVFCAKRDRYGNLWLGTTDGLIRYKDKQFTTFENPYTGVEYDPDKKEFRRIFDWRWRLVYSIDFEEEGNIWFSAGCGVCKFIPPKE